MNELNFYFNSANNNGCDIAAHVLEYLYVLKTIFKNSINDND